MAKSRLGVGLVGPGFIAKHHIDAVRRLGFADVIGIAGSSLASAERKVREYGIPRAFASLDEMLRSPDIDVIHNTTPSYLHFDTTMAALRAGKHVVSDKPLAITPEECAKLRDAAAKAGVVNGVTFNYRGNPLVQQARRMVEKDDIGKPICVHGQYLQDWLTDDTVYSWRMDPVKGGPSSALADIGSHWCDLAEHVSGLKITHVLADLATTVATRYSSGASGEAFGGGGSIAERKPFEIHAEDIASVLLKFDNGARGSLKVGQVLPGHKNDLQLEVNGRKASLRWEQERQNDLWVGHYDRANGILAKDPSLMLDEVRAYAHLPGGHQEGWPDAFANVVADIYAVILKPGTPKPATLCTFADGYRVSCIIDAMLKSHAAGNTWVEVGDPFPV